jgi:hypothetical protein
MVNLVVIMLRIVVLVRVRLKPGALRESTMLLAI